MYHILDTLDFEGNLKTWGDEKSNLSVVLWFYRTPYSNNSLVLASFNRQTPTQVQEISPYSASLPVIWEQGSRKMQHCHILQQKGRSNIRCSLRVEKMFPWRPVFILSSSQYPKSLVLAPAGNSTKYMITTGQP